MIKWLHLYMAVKFSRTAALLAGALSIISCSTRVIRVPLTEGDATPVIQAAIEQAGAFGKRPVTIELQPGDYHLYRESSSSFLYHVSNTTSESENPDPVKHICFWFKGMDNVTLDGNGARLVTHGELTGFVVDDCRNITLRNFVLTAADPTVTEFTVQETGEKHMTVKVHPQSRYRIEDGRLVFFGDGWSWSRCIAPQTYDPVRDVTWRGWNPLKDYRVEELGPGLLRLEYGRTPEAEPGQTFQMRDAIRDEVCGLIQYSDDVCLEDVHVAFAGNFGIVGQMSGNLSFRRLVFEPEAGSGRTCAGFADFLHISGCRGKVLVEGSKFSGAQDDPINVHGTHLSIQRFVSPKELKLRYMHPQTFGFQSFLEGNEVDIVDSHKLMPVGTFRVSKSEMLSEREILVTLAEPLPDEIMNMDDLVVENVTYTPEVVIRNNTFSRVPTRGILVTTRRKVLIEGNEFFRTRMSGVLIADDARSWFESGPVRDVTIRDNRFIECGTPVILIAPENDVDGGFVHRNITIEKNHFKLAGPVAVSAKSVDGLTVRGNEFVGTPGDGRQDPVVTEQCRRVVRKDRKSGGTGSE